MTPMTLRLSAAMPRAMPTPRTAPTSVWVVDMGRPQAEASTTVEAAPSSAAKPRLGVSSVILRPTVPITSRRIQPGMTDLAAISPPEATVLTTAASGPTALATSLDPWANAMAQAVNTIRMANTRSTWSKRCPGVGLSSTRFNSCAPPRATSSPTAALIGSALANFDPRPRSSSMPTCLSPLRRVTMQIMKPTTHI